jgi:(p)ppGpp synthase/HD superfamily hydrolase
MPVAQTNLQLYNQLRERGLAVQDLVLVHRAYELLAALYPGYYQADGKPFVAHGVGVASIVADAGLPAEMIAVGLLHNVYGNADFGDGRQDAVTPARRRLVRTAVGEQVEALIVRFRSLRIRPGNLQDMRRRLPALAETDRQLVLVEVADHAEKYVDAGVLYFSESDWVQEGTGAIASDLAGIAEELGAPALGDMLTASVELVERLAASVPRELHPSDGRRYLTLLVPRSCVPRGAGDAGDGSYTSPPRP